MANELEKQRWSRRGFLGASSAALAAGMSPPQRCGTKPGPNVKYPFSIAHKRLHEGGWSREVTVRELPASRTLAGVNMRLTAGGVRELRWHPNADEWQFFISGKARMTVFATGGRARHHGFRRR